MACMVCEEHRDQASSCKRRVIVGGKASAVPAGFVEGRLQRPSEVLPNQIMKRRNGIKASLSAAMIEPAAANGHMADFLVMDDLENICAGIVAGFAQPRGHLRRYIQAARFKDERYDREPGSQVVGGRFRRLPKAVMGRQVPVGRVHLRKPVAQQHEMLRLFLGDGHPVVVELSRQPKEQAS